MQLFHALFGPRICKKHLTWRQNTLVCRVCGAVAGFRYQIGDELHLFLFPDYEDQYEIIAARRDTHRLISANDVLGHISFVDFDTAIMEMKDSVANITYHGFDGLGLYSFDEEEFSDNQEDNDTQCNTDCSDYYDRTVDDVRDHGGIDASDTCN